MLEADGTGASLGLALDCDVGAGYVRLILPLGPFGALGTAGTSCAPFSRPYDDSCWLAEPRSRLSLPPCRLGPRGASSLG